jgi:hypothetical protein
MGYVVFYLILCFINASTMTKNIVDHKYTAASFSLVAFLFCFVLLVIKLVHEFR